MMQSEGEIICYSYYSMTIPIIKISSKSQCLNQNRFLAVGSQGYLIQKYQHISGHYPVSILLDTIGENSPKTPFKLFPKKFFCKLTLREALL